MLFDSIKADREFLAQLQLARGIVHRRIIKRAEDQLLHIVTVVDANPHPFGNAVRLIWEFNFDVVTLLVFHEPILP